jgi:hypothetical protein
MPRFVPALGGAAVVVMAAVLALNLIPMSGPGGPTTQPPTASPIASPSPVTEPPPPFTERFDSPLHGVSISYPSGWQTKPATEPWNHEAVSFGASDVDVIFDPTLQDDLYFALVSEPLDGQLASDWLSGAPETCRGAEGGAGGNYTLDGADGYIWSRGLRGPGVSCHVVLVATDTRAYIILLHLRNERLRETYGGPWFEAALETVDLRPEEALDALNPSQSP